MLHNEPLVRLDDRERNLLSVSPKVNTKSYHDAFMKMPMPKPVAEAAYIQAGRILQKTSGTQYEFLVAIDARTGKLVTDNFGDSPRYKGRTGFTEERMSIIRSWPNRIVVLHNHPSSKPPSYQDVITASEYPEILASIIVGHDGAAWYVSVEDPSVAGRLRSGYNATKHRLGDHAEAYALRDIIEKENGRTLDWRKVS